MYLQEMLVPTIHMQIWLASKGIDKRESKKAIIQAKLSRQKLMYNTNCYHTR